MKLKFNLFLVILLTFVIFGCNDNTTGPNEIGGETNLDITQPGNEIGVSFNFDDPNGYLLNNIQDSIYILKNENGIVTTKGKFILTFEQFNALDTMFGTYSLPYNTKMAVFDSYIKQFGAGLDTSDLNAIKVDVEMTHKVTSEGIQGFLHSKGDLSKPFTIVKYSSNVGDKYEFTTTEGKKITRTVISKATVEDWSLGFLMVKTMKVEEPTPDDPLIDNITYVANHKFGLIGVILNFKSAKVLKLTLLPWAVL